MTLNELVELLLKAAGIVVLAGGGAAGLILGPFRYFADKWLTSKFDQRLEQFKHAQQVEMENLRFRINSLFDRTTKLHQREFEVVPTAWALLVECKNQVSAFITAFQQYPDLDRMTGPQLDEFLEDSFLAKWQRDEIKSRDQKGGLLHQGDIFPPGWRGTRSVQGAACLRAEKWNLHAPRHEGKIRQNIGPCLEGIGRA